MQNKSGIDRLFKVNFFKAIGIITAILLFASALLWGFYFFGSADFQAKQGVVFQAKQEPVKAEKKTESAVIFNPKKLSWTEITPSAPWEKRDSGEVFVFKNKMWLMGGISAENPKDNHAVKYWEATHFNDIWNTEDGLNWTKVASSSAWAPRRSMSVVFFKDKLWMMGGWSPVTGYTNDIWTSTDGINWTKIVANAPWPAREGQLVEVFKNKMWLIGGVNYGERQTKNDVWYSSNGIEWTRVKNIPWKPRWDHATQVFKGKLFLAGGMNLAGETFDDIWVTDDGLKWTLITDSPPWPSRQGHALLSYKNKLWIIGRLNDLENGGVNDVWYSNDGTNWTKTENNPQWAGREDFFSTVFKDRMWVFGGMDSSWQWRNDVWASKFLSR